MVNYWLERSSTIIEKEVLLLGSNNQDAQKWYNMMPSVVYAIFNEVKSKDPDPNSFLNPIGKVYGIRMMKIGIEGILEAPRKYHKYPLYVLYAPKLKPKNPFWIVIYKNI